MSCGGLTDPRFSPSFLAWVLLGRLIYLCPTRPKMLWKLNRHLSRPIFVCRSFTLLSHWVSFRFERNIELSIAWASTIIRSGVVVGIGHFRSHDLADQCFRPWKWQSDAVLRSMGAWRYWEFWTLTATNNVCWIAHWTCICLWTKKIYCGIGRRRNLKLIMCMSYHWVILRCMN